MTPVVTRKASAGLAGIVLAGTLTGAFGLSVMTVASTGASAQGIFDLWDYPARPRKPVRRAPRIPPMTADEIKASELSDREKESQGPLVINISIKNQRVRVYDANGLVTEAPISSGRVGYSTPTGIFTILEKKRTHFSNLYDSAPMPNMQRITWSGVALHAGQLPGYPASHGCIRLPYGFSKKLFGMTKLGTRIIVSRDFAAPVAISSDHLFAAFPPDDETAFMARAATQVADASNSTVPSTTGPHDGPVTAATTGGSSQHMNYRQRRLAELAQLEATLITAGYDKLSAEIAAVQANKTAKVTRNAYNKAKLEALQLARLARKAADARDSTAKDIATIANRLETSTRMTDRERQKAGERRASLEAKLPALEEAAAAAEAEHAKAAAAMAAAEGPANTDEEIRRTAAEHYSKAGAALAAARAADQAARRREAKRAQPVSVFISRATQHLYVRQGYEPILDAPIEIANPEQPIGTHVFTAHDFKADKTDLRWTVASIGYSPAKLALKKVRAQNASKPAADSPDSALPPSAGEALERITIPEDIRDQISDVIKPGSSLVISDQKISGETGKFTDFIILTR